MSYFRLAAVVGLLLTCSTAWGQASASAPAGGGDYWVEPTKQVHAKFTGQRGTVAQFGDSITITMAFFVPLQTADIRNTPADLKEAHEWIRSYVQGRSWRGWKGPEWGNEGRTTTEWGLSNMDGWLRKMNPEIALIMWGTNDSYLGPHPPKYTDNLRAIVQKCIDNGTVPVLYTIPPVGHQAGDEKETRKIESFVEAARTVAAEKKIPLIDFYKEVMTRQPTNFAKTLMGDDLHPSFPQEFQNDFSAEALKSSGYTLRNYLTLRKMWEVNQKVLTKVAPAGRAPSASAFKGPTFRNRPAVLVPKVDAAPVVDGRIDDAVWQKAQVLEFRMLDGDVKPPTAATEARVLTTDKAFYFAFRCAEPEMDHMVSSKRPRDDGVWEDDSVEVFLLPAAKPSGQYYQFIVNPDGSYYDAFAKDKDAWNSNAKFATAKGKDYWSVEIEIPFADIRLPADKDTLAGPWRLNLDRSRPGRGSYAEETALSPTEDPSSHVPEMFAYAFLEVFGGKLPPEAQSQKAK